MKFQIKTADSDSLSTSGSLQYFAKGEF